MLTGMVARNSSPSLLFSVFAISLGWSQVAYSQTAPCQLLTQQQVSDALGVSVGAASPIATTGCSWRSTGARNVVFTVSMQSEKMFAAVKSRPSPTMTKQTVSGVGDEAVFTGVAGFASLWIKKGTKFPLVRVYGLPVGEAEAKLKTLGADAVAKL